MGIVGWGLAGFVLAGAALIACEAPPSSATISSAWQTCKTFGRDPRVQEQACTAVIEADNPNSDIARAYDNRGQARALLGLETEAIADYTESIRRSPNYFGVYYNRGAAYDRIGRYELAISDLDAGLRLEPNHPILLNEACWARAMLGRDLPRAAEYCDRAIALSQNHPSFRDTRGLLRLKRGRFAGALADYEEAMRIRPNWAHYIYGRGICLLRLGRETEGRAAIAEARALNPEISDVYARFGVTP